MEKTANTNIDSCYDEKIKYESEKSGIWEIPNDSSSSYPNVEPEKWKTEQELKTVFNSNTSVSVLDVAAYIFKKIGSMTTMKLQKLVYYCQAWSLVWDEKRLFTEKIEAWANGPVVRELYNYHRGMFEITSIEIGNSDILNDEQKETVDAVIDFYGGKSSQWLSDLTHMEDPWRLSRIGLADSERGNREISHAILAEYYGSLPPEK